MHRRTLFLIAACTLLANYVAFPQSEERQFERMGEQLVTIAQSGLDCMVAQLVQFPEIEHDVIRTDSVLNPVQGVVRVSAKDPMAWGLDGAPIAYFPLIYELTYYYEDGEWKLADLTTRIGRPLSDTSPVMVCFP